MARFVIDIESDRSLTFDLKEARTLIGRSSSTDLQIPDRRCSREHAEVVRRGGEFVLRDLDSKNKVYVNGQVIPHEYALRNGDRVRMGDTILIFQSEDAAHAASAAAEDSQNIRVVDGPETQWGSLQGSVAAGEMQPAATPLEKARGDAIGDPLRRLEILYEVADKIRSILDLSRLLDEISVILTNVLTPDALVVMLRDEGGADLRPRVVRNVKGEQEEIRISRSIVDQCMADRVAILVSDATQDVRFQASESIIAHRIRSAICAPLIHQGEVLGLIYLDSKSSVLPYQREELELVTGIVNQAATAIVNARMQARLVQQQRLEREMEIARTIQTNLLPRSAPEVGGFDIWGMSVPATKVGGDYFDYVPRGPRELALAIADVSGKGVPAALLTAIMRASLQIFAKPEGSTVKQIITQLNQTICRDASDNMFVSAVFGILDAERREFTYSNAGHCYPLLFGPDGKLGKLDVGGCFLGLVDMYDYQVATVAVPPGSTLFLFTDGLTDMINEKEELFGAERLISELAENLSLPARELCERLFATVRAHRGEALQFDDCTLLAIKSLT